MKFKCRQMEKPFEGLLIERENQKNHHVYDSRFPTNQRPLHSNFHYGCKGYVFDSFSKLTEIQVF